MRRAVTLTFAACVIVAVSVGSLPCWAQCDDHSLIDLERGEYRIQQVRLIGPPFVSSYVRAWLDRAGGLHPGAALTEALVMAEKREIDRALETLPAGFDSPLYLKVSAVAIEHCDESTHRVDVVYPFFTTRIPVGFSHTPEFRRASEVEPGRTLGLQPFKTTIAPILGYGEPKGASGGLRLSGAIPGWFDRFVVEGVGSRSQQLATAIVSGTSERASKFLSTHRWSAGYRYSNLPTVSEPLRQSEGSAQWTGQTSPLGGTDLTLRFGSMIAGGYQRSPRDAASLPPSLTSGSNYVSWKGAVGVVRQTRRHAVSASFASELARTSGGDGGGYQKYLADVSHDWRIVLRGASWTHRPIDLRSRLTMGRLFGDRVPITARFFGGHTEVPLGPEEEWVIRSTPVIRSFATNGLSASDDGADFGGDRFQAGSLTVSMPVWSIPLIPDEVSRNREVRTEIDGQMDGAVNALGLSYEADDLASREMFEHRDAMLATVNALDERLSVISESVPESATEAYDACVDEVGSLVGAIENQGKSSVWNTIAENPGEVSMASVLDALETFEAARPDTALIRLAAELRGHRAFVESRLAKVDKARARRKAEEDLRFPRTVVETIFDEINLFAVSPVFLFDAARLGPHRQDNRYRFGVGGGLRVSLASAFHMTGGYAWNPDRRAGERRGVPFFTLEFTELFGK